WVEHGALDQDRLLLVGDLRDEGGRQVDRALGGRLTPVARERRAARARRPGGGGHVEEDDREALGADHLADDPADALEPGEEAVGAPEVADPELIAEAKDLRVAARDELSGEREVAPGRAAEHGAVPPERVRPGLLARRLDLETVCEHAPPPSSVVRPGGGSG